jgi:hypothetical protein
MRNEHFTSEESFQIFSNSIAEKLQKGFTLIERNDKLPFAVLSKQGKTVDHGFNFMICCLTLGLWSVAWGYLTYVASKEKTILVAIDEDGTVFQDNCAY